MLRRTVKSFALDAELECLDAQGKFPKFYSYHEGYAIIKEELDELWDEIKKKPYYRRNEAMKKEATQVAAMAIRFLYDLCNQGED